MASGMSMRVSRLHQSSIVEARRHIVDEPQWLAFGRCCCRWRLLLLFNMHEASPYSRIAFNFYGWSFRLAIDRFIFVCECCFFSSFLSFRSRSSIRSSVSFYNFSLSSLNFWTMLHTNFIRFASALLWSSSPSSRALLADDERRRRPHHHLSVRSL